MARTPERVNQMLTSHRVLMPFCDEAESIGMEARCCNWHPRVQQSSTGVLYT